MILSNPPVEVQSVAGYEGLASDKTIAILPEVLNNLNSAAERIWKIARNANTKILLIGLVENAGQESKLRRDLIALSGLIKGVDCEVSTEIIEVKNWVFAIKSRITPGDILICFSGHRTGLCRKPISDTLRYETDLPIYTLANDPIDENRASTWTSGLLSWLGSIALIAVFFALQTKIKDNGALVLGATIPVEVWALTAWNSLFG